MAQNPFLLSYRVPEGGRLTVQGQPLSRLQIPQVTTLISQPSGPISTLAEVNVARAFLELTPSEQVNLQIVGPDDPLGMQLNPNIVMDPSVGGTINPAQAQAIINRRIPTNAREARDMLAFIIVSRTGSENRAFGINELKQICKNLNLPASGSKAELATRIRSYIIEFFNLPD